MTIDCHIQDITCNSVIFIIRNNKFMQMHKIALLNNCFRPSRPRLRHVNCVIASLVWLGYHAWLS